jgi:hypothetical protein
MSTQKIHEALAAMKSCIKSGEPWTATMELAYLQAMTELRALQVTEAK